MEVRFCTVTSKYRLHQCLALYRSLKRHMKKASFSVLCIDTETHSALLKLQQPDMHVFSLEDMGDKELIELKDVRGLSEYCWTLKPAFLLHVYEKEEEADIIAYLDSDLFFFDNPMKIFKKYKSCNILLTPHKINRKANGGFAAFRRNQTGHDALTWWKEKCIEWCYAYNEGNRFADQGYLDALHKLYSGVSYAHMQGVNIANWNYFKYDLKLKGNQIYIGESPLIFYHFSGFRMESIESSAADIPCIISQPYLKELRQAIKDIEAVNPDISENFYLGL